MDMDDIKPHMAKAKEPYTIKVKNRRHKAGFKTKKIWPTHYSYNVTLEQWDYMRDNNKWPRLGGEGDSQSVEVRGHNRVTLENPVEESMWDSTPIQACKIGAIIFGSIIGLSFILKAIFGGM